MFFQLIPSKSNRTKVIDNHNSLSISNDIYKHKEGKKAKKKTTLVILSVNDAAKKQLKNKIILPNRIWNQYMLN